MRIYIIGSDGIALCREAPAAVNDGEIVVASKEELHAAPLNGKRLLALWNALPGVDKRRKVGDREALIDELWSAIERLPDPEPRPEPPREAGRGDCHPASARGRNGRRGGERDRLAASYRPRRLFGNFEEKARADPRFGQRGARPRLPHRRAGERMTPRAHDASARQHSDELSPVPGSFGKRSSRLGCTDLAKADHQIAELLDRSTPELRLAWRQLHRTGPPPGLSRDLLIRALVYQLQERAAGGASRALRRRLQTLVGEFEN